MKIIELTESRTFVEGTSCFNCAFTRGEKGNVVSKDELNKNGGIKSTDKTDLSNAKKADVITMPGKKMPDTKKWCKHKDVDQWVTERMCCDLWESTGIHTEY